MEVILNGERCPLPANFSVRELLHHLKVPADRVAVERNRAIVPRDAWERIRLETGDELEIVYFVGGG